MGNRRKNSGSIDYYVAETYASADFVYGEVCKIGADSSSKLFKLDGVAYNGPVEIRKDDFISVSRQAAQTGVGRKIRLTADITPAIAIGDTLEFTVKGVAFEGGVRSKNFRVVATAATAAGVGADIAGYLTASLPSQYVVTDNADGTVDIDDNIGGGNAWDKLEGVLEGELYLDCVVASGTAANLAVTQQTAQTIPYGQRGNVNRNVDEAYFSTGDVYTTVSVEYWDRDADGRARGDVLVRKQLVAYFNESDISSATGLTAAHLNSLVDALIAYSGVGVGAPVALVAMTAAAYANVTNENAKIPEGAPVISITMAANGKAVALPADTINPVGYSVLSSANASSTSGIFSEGETLANANTAAYVAMKTTAGVYVEVIDL